VRGLDVRALGLLPSADGGTWLRWARHGDADLRWL